MVMIYTKIECEKDCFQSQIVGVVDHFGSGRSVEQNYHYFRSYMRKKKL